MTIESSVITVTASPSPLSPSLPLNISSKFTPISLILNESIGISGVEEVLPLESSDSVNISSNNPISLKAWIASWYPIFLYLAKATTSLAVFKSILFSFITLATSIEQLSNPPFWYIIFAISIVQFPDSFIICCMDVASSVLTPKVDSIVSILTTLVLFEVVFVCSCVVWLVDNFSITKSTDSSQVCPFSM